MWKYIYIAVIVLLTIEYARSTPLPSKATCTSIKAKKSSKCAVYDGCCWDKDDDKCVTEKYKNKNHDHDCKAGWWTNACTCCCVCLGSICSSIGMFFVGWAIWDPKGLKERFPCLP